MGKSYKDKNKRNLGGFDKRNKRLKQEKTKYKTSHEYSDYGSNRKSLSWDEEGY